MIYQLPKNYYRTCVEKLNVDTNTLQWFIQCRTPRASELVGGLFYFLWSVDASFIPSLVNYLRFFPSMDNSGSTNLFDMFTISQSNKVDPYLEYMNQHENTIYHVRAVSITNKISPWVITLGGTELYLYATKHFENQFDIPDCRLFDKEYMSNKTHSKKLGRDTVLTVYFNEGGVRGIPFTIWTYILMAYLKKHPAPALINGVF